MRRLPPLSSLRAFEAAARHGSFKQAADELAVTPTAISHQIRSLEAHAGQALFERSARKVSLTAVGGQLYPVLRKGFDAFEAAFEDVLQTRPRAQVAISATNAFTARWLVPRVARFRSLQPAIDLRLHASDETVDLEAHSIDIAVRYGVGPYPDLCSEPMFADEYAPLANPALGIKGLEDLEQAPLIHFEWKKKHPLNPTWAHWFETIGSPPPSNLSHLKFNDESHAIQAAVAGQGVALLSLPLVADELAAGHLISPFGPVLKGFTYHLVMRQDRSTHPNVQAVVDWLRSEAANIKAARLPLPTSAG